MLAAAATAAGEESSRGLIGGSLGMEGMNELFGARARGLGTSITFTFKMAEPFAMIGQVGAIGWPSAFHLGQASEVPDKAPWEMFVAATLLPLTLGPVDLGIVVRLLGPGFIITVAKRWELGLAIQWRLDRTWALRYQAGCSLITNFMEPTFVSTLTLDVAFPAFI